MISFKPKEKTNKQFKQTLPSDLRSNIYNNHMEYPIYFIYLLLIFFANRYYKYRAETCLWLLYMQNWISLHWRQYSQFQMQKVTVIQGPKELMLLSYHWVLPYLSGSPWIPLPAWVGCTHGCGASLLPVSIYLYSMSCSSNEKGANLSNLSLCNNQFHTWSPCLIQTIGVIWTLRATYKEGSPADAAKRNC